MTSRPSGDLIMNGGNHRIRTQFLDVGRAELFLVGRRKLEPPGKGIASNHRGLLKERCAHFVGPDAASGFVAMLAAFFVSLIRSLSSCRGIPNRWFASLARTA